MKNVDFVVIALDFVGKVGLRVTALLLAVVGGIIGCLAPIWIMVIASACVVVGIVHVHRHLRRPTHGSEGALCAALSYIAWYAAALIFLVPMWGVYGIASLPW